MSDLEKEVKICISIVETALINAILEFLKKQSYEQVSHLIESIINQTNHYTLENLKLIPKEEGKDDAQS